MDLMGLLWGLIAVILLAKLWWWWSDQRKWDRETKAIRERRERMTPAQRKKEDDDWEFETRFKGDG